MKPYSFKLVSYQNSDQEQYKAVINLDHVSMWKPHGGMPNAYTEVQIMGGGCVEIDMSFDKFSKLMSEAFLKEIVK